MTASVVVLCMSAIAMLFLTVAFVANHIAKLIGG